MTSTAKLRKLTAEQRAEIEQLAAHPHLTILIDSKYGQAWQIMRARRYRRGNFYEVAIMMTIGMKDEYVLDLNEGPENEHELVELLDGVTYTVVPVPQPAAAVEQPAPESPIRAAAQLAAEKLARYGLRLADRTHAGLFLHDHAPELLGETDEEYDANCAALVAFVRAAEVTVTLPTTA